MTNAQLINEILVQAGSQFVTITFEKKDGTERKITVNPKEVGEIKGTGTKCADPNIFRVVDSKIGQWRSFDARRVIKISSKGSSTELTKEEA
jgi:hypothetical protein